MRFRVPPFIRVLLCSFVSLFLAAPLQPAHPSAQSVARNVVVITLDGLRWQEFFGGPDSAYFKKGKNGEILPAEKFYWRATPEEGRARILPFMWGTIAKQGQIFRARLTNGLWFSYPGYNEMLSGAADKRIDSNNKVPNPNVTVLEWLNGRPGFAGKVAAFGAWDVLPFILNVERSKLPVGSGFDPMPNATTERGRMINQLAHDLPPYWDYGTYDAPIVYAAIETLRTSKPRVMYVMLGEGDEWAHAGRYDLYVDATLRADRFIQRIWETLQSMPEYKDRTTLLVTTDHGRGASTKDWTDHGRDVPAAEQTWMAVLGPDVPALGLREDVTATTSQLAATIAAAVGEDFNAARAAAAPPLPIKRP